MLCEDPSHDGTLKAALEEIGCMEDVPVLGIRFGKQPPSKAEMRAPILCLWTREALRAFAT